MTKRHRREEIARLLEQRERGGLTYRELSQRCGLSPRTLSWWAWKLRREGAGSSPAFVEVDVADREPCSSVELETIEQR